MFYQEKVHTMEATLSALTQADGSCELWREGRGRVVCGVSGPGDVSGSKRLFDRATVFFSINRLPARNREGLVATMRPAGSSSTSSTSSPPQPIDHFLHSIVEGAIDVGAYPRTCIQICTQELGMDGPGDALQLNGICLALIDAGIRMRHIFGAITVALPKDSENLEMTVDPNQMETDAAKALFTFVFKPSVMLAGKLIGTHSTGAFTVDEYKKALELAERRCLSVFDFYRRKVQQKFIYHLRISSS